MRKLTKNKTSFFIRGFTQSAFFTFISRISGFIRDIFIGYLIDESEQKFIVTNEKGNIEMHYPKKDYSYTIVEDKWKML